MEINKLVRRAAVLMSKGLIVALIGTSASLYKPALAEAPNEPEGWNPPNIQTLLEHPLVDKDFELSEQAYNTYLLYNEVISAGLTYKDFKKLKTVASCESSLFHEGIFGDSKLAYGFFQIHRPTFEFFIKKMNEQKIDTKDLKYEDIQSQIKVTVWAYQNNLMYHWTCWK